MALSDCAHCWDTPCSCWKASTIIPWEPGDGFELVGKLPFGVVIYIENLLADGFMVTLPLLTTGGPGEEYVCDTLNEAKNYATNWYIHFLMDIVDPNKSLPRNTVEYFKVHKKGKHGT